MNDRMEAMKMIQAGKPMDTQTNFKYTPGAGGPPCCTIA